MLPFVIPLLLPLVFASPSATATNPHVSRSLARGDHIGHDHYNHLQCDAWLKLALESDANSSRGLDRFEFSALMENVVSGGHDNDNIIVNDASLSVWFREEFDSLACECHETFGMDEKCCDDTATDDDDDDDNESDDDEAHMLISKSEATTTTTTTATDDDNDNDNDVWKQDSIPQIEILLTGFEKESQEERTRNEQKYRHAFCKALYRGMQKEGVDVASLGGEVVSGVDSESEGGLNGNNGAAIISSTTATAAATGATSSSSSSSSSNSITQGSVTGSTAMTSNIDDLGSTEASEQPTFTTTKATESSASIISSTTTTTTTTTTSVSSASNESATSNIVNQYDISFIGSTNNKYTAQDVLLLQTQQQSLNNNNNSNNSNNNNSILNDVTKAFWKVSVDILEEFDYFANVNVLMMEEEEEEDGDGSNGDALSNNNNNNNERYLQQQIGLTDGFVGEEASFLFESLGVDVKDIECQSGVIYAPPNAPCLEFTFSLTPLKGGPLTFQDMQTYLTNFLTATNSKGELYNAIIAINPDTEIVGMGSPGGGIPLIVVADGNEDDGDSSTPSTPSQIVKLNSGGDGTNSVQGSGLGVGGMVGIIVAIAAIAIVLVASIIRKRKNEEARRLCEFAGEAALAVDDDLEANSVHKDVVAIEEAGEGCDNDGVEVVHSKNAMGGDDDDDSKSHSSSIVSEEDKNNDESLEIIVENDSTTGQEQRLAAGSTLAAMGVASTVATRLSISPQNASS